MRECRGFFDGSSSKCLKCNEREACEQERAAIRELIISKLDAGSRQLLIGHLWTIGDALASNPIGDAVRIIMLSEAYMNSFGVTELGKTGLMDPKLYDRVQKLRNDLTDYLHVMFEVYPKCESRFEFDTLVAPTLVSLEDKYSKITGERIYGNPTRILRAIKDIFYRQDMFPLIISHITTVTSMNSMGYSGFNGHAPPRFRNPAIDGGKK